MTTSSLILEKWLVEQCELTDYQLFPIQGDASFRRYFRVQTAGNHYIAMDAAVEKQSCIPFVAIADALRQQEVHTPRILASDFTQGFLLLSDFGDRRYLDELKSSNAKKLYMRALDALWQMQACADVPGWKLKPFDAKFVCQELDLFVEWFLVQHLSLQLSAASHSMLKNCFTFLAQTAASQPQVFMHRDYHSANLMYLPDSQVGVLDFQDAFVGPLTYDLVSLLRDCYIAWPDHLVTECAQYYWEKSRIMYPSRWDEFLRWFDLMGIQRHLKALLTFARKYRRDGHAGYLQHIPRTLQYILQVSQRYIECHDLSCFLHEQVAKQCVE